MVEALGGDDGRDAGRFLEVLSDAMEEGVVADGAIAQSQSERDAMWAIRDDVGQVRQHRPVSSFGNSVPLSKMDSYVVELRQALNITWPGNHLSVFGHLCDGNLHIVVGVGDKSAKAAVEAVVYEGLPKRGGSVSAEHGIGIQKKQYLGMSRSADEILVM